jgi:hypothetical protein
MTWNDDGNSSPPPVSSEYREGSLRVQPQRLTASVKSWCSLWKGGFGTNPPSGGPAESINKSTFPNFSNLFNSFVQPLLAPRARRASAPLRPASGASVYKSVRSIPPFAIDLRAPFAARLEARAPRRRCALTPESCQLVPAQRPTDASCARGRQICPQHSLHLPSTDALLSPRASKRSRCGGDEL